MNLRELTSRLGGLAPESFLRRGGVVLDSRLGSPIRELFDHRAFPDRGWSDDQLEHLLLLLSSMDTDKDPKAARVGEREARLASPLLSRLSGGFNHGVGRSGDLSAPQPKAPGASVVQALASRVATSALKKLSLANCAASVVLPVGTGMGLFFCLAAARARLARENNGGGTRDGHGTSTSKTTARAWTPEPSPWSQPGFPTKVVVPRLDHKSPLKAVELAGFEPVVVPSELNGDEVRVPPERVEEAVDESVAAILSTTTFFPPRAPDDLKAIAKVAKSAGVAHIVNNAYGVQHPSYLKSIRSAADAGRVDYVVQSTDKNFLTPVGGSIVATFEERAAVDLAKCYAGRASAAPIVHFLVAALSLGLEGYRELQRRQVENRRLLEEYLSRLADQLGERVMDVDNPIAAAMTLRGLPPDARRAVGGALYSLRVTGPRVVDPAAGGWGTCHDAYPNPYVVVNAAIGARPAHVTAAVERLGKAIEQVQSRRGR
ncbi:MAG: O-phosphoseryl-tRNA(Sec) selenium transferase [Promethearchaeota archaeon]